MARPSKIWQRKGRPGWFATIGGKKVRLGESREAAEKAFHAALAAASGPGFPTGVLLYEAVDRFLASVLANRKPATVAAYTRGLTAVVKTTCDGRPLSRLPVADLRPFHLDAVFAGRPKWSGSTRRMVGMQLLTALNWAVRQGYAERNPLAGKVDLPPKRSRGRESVFTPADLDQVLHHATPEFREFVTAMRFTGCRPGEVAAVRVEDVDLARGLWIMADHKTDADGMPRVVHLSAGMLELTQDLVRRRGSGPLFRNAVDGTWNNAALREAMRRVRRKVKAAGGRLVGRCILYGLRHTFATDLLTAGVPDAHVAALLGHKSTAMLHKHYNHLTGNAGVLRAHLSKLTVPGPDTGTRPPSAAA